MLQQPVRQVERGYTVLSHEYWTHITPSAEAQMSHVVVLHHAVRPRGGGYPEPTERRAVFNIDGPSVGRCSSLQREDAPWLARGAKFGRSEKGNAVGMEVPSEVEVRDWHWLQTQYVQVGIVLPGSDRKVAQVTPNVDDDATVGGRAC